MTREVPIEEAPKKKSRAGAGQSSRERAKRPLSLPLRTGFWLLAVSIPLGVTLETLHGFKVQSFLAGEVRRELWRLSHAHGTLLGILCLVFAVLAPRHLRVAARAPVGKMLSFGAVAVPLGFFAGGILNSEGDPSIAIVLVPAGAVLLLWALARAAHGIRS